MHGIGAELTRARAAERVSLSHSQFYPETTFLSARALAESLMQVTANTRATAAAVQERTSKAAADAQQRVGRPAFPMEVLHPSFSFS